MSHQKPPPQPTQQPADQAIESLQASSFSPRTPADVLSWITLATKPAEPVAFLIPLPGESQTDANIRAFKLAAAPELYAACHAAIAYLDAEVPYGPNQPVFAQLCQAIAKADGARFETVGQEPDPRD